jgi:hypothetical protein
MINLPNSIAKGEVLSFALNKALVTAAVSDPYWSDSANISKCIVVYRSTSGRQRKRLEFDFTQESPTVAAEWSAKARNSFEIEEIVLMDFDGGSYVIQRSALPSGKGISFDEEGGGGGTIVTQVVHNYAPNGAVNDMVTDGTNVWIGGAFSSIRYSAPNMAVIDPSTGENLVNDQGTGRFPAFNGAIHCFAYDGENTLYVGGEFTTVDNVSRPAFAKLVKVNGNWLPDVSWNSTKFFAPLTDAVPTVKSILVDGDTLYLGGLFSAYRPGANVVTGQITSVHFVGFNKNTGEFVCTVAPGVAYNILKAVTAIVKDGDELIVAFNRTDSPKKINKLTGAVNNSFSCALTFVTGTMFTDLAISGDSLYVGGMFTAVNGTTIRSLAKVNKNSGVLDSGFASMWASSSTTSYVRTILVSGDSLFVGGVFSDDVNLRRNVVKLNASSGARIDEFNPGYTFTRHGQASAVNRLVEISGSFYAFGNFDGRSLVGNPQTCINAAKFNPVSGELNTVFATTTSLLDSATETINAAILDSSRLIVGGSFSGWGGGSNTRQGVAKLTKDADGNWKVVEAFNTFGTGVTSMALSGNDLYIAGTFTTWAGESRNRVARLNATTGALDPSFGVGVFTSGVTAGQFNGVTSTVRKILLDGEDLVIAGDFTTYSRKSSTSTPVNTSTPYWIRVNTATNTESVPSFGSGGSTPAIVSMDIRGEEMFVVGGSTWGGVVQSSRVHKINKFTGERNNQFVGAPHSASGIVFVSENALFFFSGVNVTVGSSFVLNKETGESLKAYQPGNFRVDQGEFFETSDWVYFGGSFGATTSNFQQHMVRFSKETYEHDPNWGKRSQSFNASESLKCVELVGSEIILGMVTNSTTSPSNGLGLNPYGKRLFSINFSNGSQKFNI